MIADTKKRSLVEEKINNGWKRRKRTMKITVDNEKKAKVKQGHPNDLLTLFALILASRESEINECESQTNH